MNGIEPSDFGFERVAYPQGDRVKLGMTGKFLPFKYYGATGNEQAYGYKEESGNRSFSLPAVMPGLDPGIFLLVNWKYRSKREIPSAICVFVSATKLVAGFGSTRGRAA